MKKMLLFVAIAAISSAADARGLKMTFTAHEGQTLRMDAGLAAISGNLPNSSARILQPEGDVRKRGSFSLAVFNAGKTPFNIGPENVSITFADGSTGTVITYERLVKEEKKRQMWLAAATILGAAADSMSAANAGYTSGSASYSSTTNGRYGSTTTYGTAYYSGYDAAAARSAQDAANARTDANVASLIDYDQRALAALKVNLRTTTVDPGQSVGGAIMFEVPKPLRGSKQPLQMVIHVTTGAETHDFAATLARGD
jgi:hypothetical protein